MDEVIERYVEVNQITTTVSSIGKQIGEPFNESEDLVIVIPGNPGITSFYDKFIRKISEKLKCSVWCVGHAGQIQEKHEIRPLPKFEEHKELYGLMGQVQHKADFFKKYVPENVRVHLVGHSIGSYMALNMLDDPSIERRVEKAYLLFPTLEYMAQTPNGKFLTNFVKHIVWLLVLLSGLFAIFPTFFQNVLLHIFMFFDGVPEEHLENIRQLIRPDPLRRVFFLAHDEMALVLQRNDHSIKNNLKKLKFLYGKHDGWAPLSYYDNLKKEYPNADAEVTNLEHAFVLRSSSEVGDILCDWITRKNLLI